MPTTFWISDEQMDVEQGRAVEDMPEDASFLLTGPAGSGKTNILLLRAKWFLFKKLSEFKIIVFNSSLREFLKVGCAQYKIPADKVITCHSFLTDFLRQYNVDVTLSGQFETDRAMLAGKAQSLVDSKNVQPIYDALLVDECQDYMDTELLVLRRLTKRLVLAADSRQSIYRATHTPDLLQKLVKDQTVVLKYHYRSGLKLCKVADSILRDPVNFPPIHGQCRYDEAARPSSVIIEKPLPRFDAQVDLIIERLPAQLDLYPEEFIGVLFPKKEQVNTFRDKLDGLHIADRQRVIVDTMHGAKGLEFRAVHLGGCEALSRMGPVQKRLAYTSVLRARTAVTIYYTDSIPGYLESAVAQLEAPVPSPRLKSLFGS